MHGTFQNDHCAIRESTARKQRKFQRILIVPLWDPRAIPTQRWSTPFGEDLVDLVERGPPLFTPGEGANA
jgi:hypothetical protein